MNARWADFMSPERFQKYGLGMAFRGWNSGVPTLES